MNLLQTRRPRAFSHRMIYADERDERLHFSRHSKRLQRRRWPYSLLVALIIVMVMLARYLLY